MDTNIHSIWVEDEQSSKFHLNDPNLQVVNSDRPILSSKEHIQLPPLPPSSFFSSLNHQQKETKSKKTFIKAFKKLLNDEQPKKQVRRKISTPFGFNHISHIDNNCDNITVSQLHELPSQQPKPEETVEIIKDPTRRVSTSARAFCTSPQLVVSKSQQPAPKSISRSFSNATSLNNSMQSFPRSASISTMATSISSKTHSRKPSTQLQHHKSHKHQDSSSSIENLKKLEKNQIQKQTSIDYSSSNSSMHWATPDPQSVSRQSWVYEDSRSPATQISKTSPLNIRNFSSQLDDSFTSEHDMNELVQSMDDFTKFFKSLENPDEFDQENLNDTIASIRAAKHIRASRLSMHQDPKYLSFIEEFDRTTTSTDSTCSLDNCTRSVLKELQDELDDQEQKLETPIQFNSDESPQFDSDLENTPKQMVLPCLV